MKLRTLVIVAAALLIAGVPLFAQYAPSGGDSISRGVGRFVASQYNYSSQNNYVTVGNSATGAATITVQVSSIKLNDGRTVYPYNITAPVIVGSGSNQELVTPTAVSNCTTLSTPSGNGTCQITATFANTHGFGDQLQSGTAGLAEAVYEAFLVGGGVVNIDTIWANGVITGCTGCFGSANAAIYGLVVFPTVTIEDTRTGVTQWWNVKPGTTTALATPAALTGQAACDATHTFCSDATVAGSASWGGSIFCGITYVDILGNESLTSTTASFTSVASKAIDIGAPAASAGAVGWKPYCSVSGGTYALAYSLPLLTQPTVLQAVPLSSGVCTLTTLETVTPACALVNATYGQVSSSVGAAGLFSKGGAQFTGYPVVTSQLAPNLDSASAQSLNPSNGGLTVYKYVPGGAAAPGGLQSTFMSFPVTTAAQTTIGQVAGTIPIPAGFMDYVGRTIEVCGMISKTSTNADTITNIQLWWDSEGSNVTAGTAVELSNIQVTSTNTAAATYTFCQDITTTVASASATGGTITPGMGWMTTSQVAAGTVPVGSTNILFAAVGSLNLAINAKLEVVYNHTTGTDGAGVILINPTVKILN